QVAVEGKDTQSRRYAQTSKDIEVYGLEVESILAQVFIKERREQEQASRACQAGEKTKETGQPPLPTTHAIETEQGQEHKQRLIIGGSKKECSGKHRVIKHRAVRPFVVEILGC